MNSLWFVFIVSCLRFAVALDLGPNIRIAQCKRQCLIKHSVDGACNSRQDKRESVCAECSQNCVSLETQWEATKFICEGDEYLRCPACQTACQYRNTRVEEEYQPSSLPAPTRGPVKLGKYDIAILMRKMSNVWKEHGYFTNSHVPTLSVVTWIIVVLEDSIKHYSAEEWIPTLASLKEGPLVEATLTWDDVDAQIEKSRREFKNDRTNYKERQDYLENYGAKILKERSDSTIPEDVFHRFFFRTGLDVPIDQSSVMWRPYRPIEYHEYRPVRRTFDRLLPQESYVVSWEPETGGLMGNQIVDTRTAQISLLPGTKYLVRIASNDGPGSFPIEIDTRTKSVDVWKMNTNLDNIFPLALVAGAVCACFVIVTIILVKLMLRSKKKEIIDEEVV